MLISPVVVRAKRALHWGFQSRLRVIYNIWIYVGMSRMSN